MKNDNLKIVLWALVLAVCLAIILFLLNSGLLLSAAILLYDGVLFLWHFLASIDQEVYWIGLLILCGLAAITVLPELNFVRKPPSQAYDFRQEHPIDRWLSILNNALQFPYEQENLSGKLRELLHNLPPDQVSPQYPQGSQQPPADIDRLTENLEQQPGLFSSSKLKKAYKNSVMETIEFLEKELEIKHEE